MRAVLALATVGTLGCGTSAALRDGSSGAPDASADAGVTSVRAVVDEHYLPALESLLDGARREVWVVHFELNRDSAGDALVAKLAAVAARGVQVRVLLEDGVASNAARVGELATAGVAARLDANSRYTHAKLVVVDGAAALLGSTNWSWASLHRNHETDLLVEDAAAAGYFARYARALWDDPSRTPAMAPVETPAGTALVTGGYVDEAAARIDAARTRVALVVYGMNADPKYPDGDVNVLIRRLGAARRRGVPVRVVLERGFDAGVEMVNREAARALAAEGVEVRLDPADRITHAKLLVADDRAIVGSNNWGHGGFRLYHEVAVSTPLASAVAPLAAYFDALWAESAPP
jgi:cardiolipin synthase